MNVIKDKLSNSSKPKKEKIVKYETIFDHNATDEERRDLTEAKNKEEYLKMVSYDLDQCYYDLYWLYANRNNDNDDIISEKYAKKSKKLKEEGDKLMSLMIP